FAAGSAADVIITVPITKDHNYETNETFQVELFNPVNAAVLSGADKVTSASKTATIIDNDEIPTITLVNPAPVTEGNSGTKNMAFKVVLSAANERDANVTVGFSNPEVPEENGGAN